MLHLWRDLPIVLAAPAQTLFVLLYTVPRFGAGQWWADFVGRALAFKSTTLLLLIDVASIGYIAALVRGARLVWDIDASSPTDLIVVVGYWLVAAAIYYQLAALIHQRRR